MIKKLLLEPERGEMKHLPGTFIIPQKKSQLVALLMVDCLTGHFYYNKKSPVWVGNTSDIFIIF